jgi:peptide/nickel transport system substrate-binding protein
MGRVHPVAARALAVGARLRPLAAPLVLWGLAAGVACRPASPRVDPAAPAWLTVGLAQPAGGAAPERAPAQVAALLRHAMLLTIGRDGLPQPGLAERWEPSADGLVWHFELRPGLTFHDGSPLDARAVEAVLEAYIADGGDVGLAPGLRDVAAIDARSPTTLELRLRRPSALLPEALAIVAITGGADGQAAAGPFRVVSESGDLTELEAFPAYYRGRPQVSRVRIHAYQSPRAAWAALLRRDIDFLYELSPEAAPFVEGTRDVETFTFLRPYVFVLGFNLAHPALADPRVRRALDAAVDRQAIIDVALGGRGLAAMGHVWPRHWAHDSTLAPPTYDPVAAARALDAAGWPLPPASAGRLQGMPSRFRLTTVLPAAYPQFERLALVVQKQLLDVGVDLVLEPLPRQEFQARLAAGRFDAYLIDLAGGHGLNWPYWFWHSPEGGPPWIRSHYRAADAALDGIRFARTRAELREAIHAFQRVLLEDPPALFLCWGETSRAVRRRFVVPRDADKDVFATIAQWRAAGPGP